MVVIDSIDAFKCTTAFPQWSRAFRVLTGIEVHLLDKPTIQSVLREMTETAPGCRRCKEANCDRDKCRTYLAAELQQENPRRFEPRSIRCAAGAIMIAYAFPLADGSDAFLCLGPLEIEGAGANDGTRQRSAGPSKKSGRLPVSEPSVLEAAVMLLGLLAGELAHHSRRLIGEFSHAAPACAAVRRCRAMIELRFSENLHLHQVAKEIGVSRAYLSHAFLNTQGVSFTDCLAGRRVAEMQRLLEDSALTITEAMFAAGFQSIAQANRVFRKLTGMSPREFQRQLRA